MIKKTIFSFIVLLLASASIMAQQLIQGKITDEHNEPLPGATVRILNTRIGTIADVDGMYAISVPKGLADVKLRFSFIGKATQTIVWKGQKHLNVKLRDKDNKINEVVITARPNINELDVRAKTGSVMEADMPLLKEKPSASLGLALQGNVPGLQIINQGELGTRPQIRLRGTSSLRKGDFANEPLYVMDGNIITPETFFNLNPEDIKSIKILKDAIATALYGIKAANGVVEITSTRGFNGGKRVGYSMKMGITFVGQRSAEMMDSPEKLELERLLENASTPGYQFSEKYIRLTHPNDANIDKLIAKGAAVIDSLSHIHTDWYRELLSTNFYQSHTLSMRGGGDATSYYSSIGYMSQGGQIKGNDVNRISARLGLDQKIASNAILGLSMNAAVNNVNTPNGEAFPITDLVYKLNPYETVNSTNLYSFPNRGYKDLFNQFSKKGTNASFGASAYLNYNILPELELSAVGGVDFLLEQARMIVPPTAFDEVKWGSIPVEARGKLSEYKNTTTNLSMNIRLTYRKTFGNHSVVFGGNTDYYSTNYDNLDIVGRGLFGKARSAAAIDNNLDGIYRAKVGGKNELLKNFGVGFIGGYTYKDTYDLFTTLKLDASSVLPANKRWNTAWAVGLGWNLKQYPFLERREWIKSLRLRGSYGYTANLQGISPQNTVATFEYTSGGYNHMRGLKLMALPNKDLHAEKNHVMDFGVETSLGGTDLSLSYYDRRTTDALLEIPIPSSNGFVTQWRNIGILDNSGIELMLSQKLFEVKDFSSRVRCNIAYNKNKVISLYGKKRIYTDPQSVIPDYEVGQPVDLIYGLESNGINPINGEPTYRLHDGKEGSVFTNFNREDYVVLGHSTPPITGGLMFAIYYRNLEFNMDFYYTLGGKRSYQLTYVRRNSNVMYNAIKGQVNDMWFHEGDDNRRYPSPFIISAGYANLEVPTTRKIGVTDMLRLNSMSLRYRLDSNLLKKMGNIFQSMVCGIEGANLLTFTRFSDSDPESGNIVAPLQPILTFSLNVSF